MELVANGMMGDVFQILVRICVISIMDSILKAHEDVVYLRLVRNFAYKSGYDR
jgi:hypothetical protein